MATANGKIAKNTLLLYFRMILLTGISLITVRVNLNALGAVDYGVYNVIGSVVFAISFLTGTLSSATQRYFSYHLGKNDIDSYRKTFSILMICFASLCAFVLLVGESMAPWAVTEWLKIPSDRIYAAKWVYQTTLIGFILSMMSIPFTSSMIAHEKMNGFAYISIADGLFRLGIAYAIYYSSIDRLILYGVLNAAESVMVLALNYAYCRYNFAAVRFKFYWEKGMFKELMSYTGWNLFGSISGILVTQGQNILLNVYFGPIINAAKAIADRIMNVVQSFSTNFYMAVSPQIVKSYANGERNRMINLVNTSSKFSFFLLLVIAYPLIINMNSILYLWLGAKEISGEMVIFSRLGLIYCLLMALEQPITQMIRATGKIKTYQIAVGCFTLLYLPIAALFLYLGFSPQTTMVVLICVIFFVQFIRLIIARRQLNFSIRLYFKSVLLKITLVSSVCILGGYLLDCIFSEDTIVEFAYRILSSFTIGLISVVVLGINKSERGKIISALKSKISRKK